MQNRLQFEKSPYLLQHKSNPVHWLPWGSAAFDTAQAEDKPIFLSIGYSTCHWCHVMAHESFEDQEVAEAINRGFIPIKVDREERPDVDAVYMAACIAMNGSGGWPLTVLMTPDQKPFWAGTYLPKHGLLSLLHEAERLWREERGELLSAGEELTDHLRQAEETRPGAPKQAIVDRAATQFAQSFDSRWGGFGRAPKFPTPHNLIFLMRYANRTKNRAAMKMAEVTLEAMYRGGLFDHVGGGLSRYSTDAQWLVPHFEKMLYDNALLVFAYTEAFQNSHRQLYETVVRRTVEYVLRELEAPHGGFFCGQDADSEGVEGKYYVFTPNEVYGLLGKEDAVAFCHRYGVTERGNFEGKSIPNLIGQQDIDTEPEGMDAIRERLRVFRLERTALHKDDKILTAWNGLMIAALAKAGLALNERSYLEAAKRAASFISQNLTDQNGRLLARWREGESAHSGKLDDYAFLAWGLLELYETTFEVQYLREARRLADLLLTYFFDEEGGGFYPYSSDGEQLVTRTKEVYDGAMPSGNAVAALVLLRLARFTGENRWREAAQKQVSCLAGAVAQHPLGHSFTMLALLEELWPGADLVCTGESIPHELMTLLRENTHPGLRVLVKTPENQLQLAELAPFTEAYPVPDHGMRYYLCRNGTCEAPVDDISKLDLTT